MAGDDVASLGFDIDTASLVQGSLALKQVATTGAQATDSTKQFATAQTQSTAATRQSANESHRLAEENMKLFRIVASLVGDVSRLTSAMNDNAKAAQGVTKANESVASSAKAANDNIKAAGQGAQAAGQGFVATGKSIFATGAEILKIAGFIKLAATVAYAASPALRGLVGTGLTQWAEKATPVIARMGTTVGALTPNFIKSSAAVQGFTPAVAKATSTLMPFVKISEGFEMAMMIKSFGLAGAAALALSPALRQVAAKEVTDGIKAIGPAAATITPPLLAAGKAATQTFGPAIIGALSFASKIALPILAAVSLFKLLQFSVELAEKQMKKSAEIMKKSLESGLGPELLQRIEETAKAVNVSVNSMTETMKKFNEVTRPKVQGFDIKEIKEGEKPPTFDATSDFQKRLDELIKLGNFADNRFVEAFKNAETTEQRWRAVGNLITEAGNQGERLAALNLASTFLSPEMMERLKAMPDLLAVAQEKADLLSRTKIISTEDIARSLLLQKRLEDAEKILSEKWIPAQEQLTAIGMEFKAVWVLIVELLAASLGYINELLAKLPNLGTGLANVIARIPGLGGIILGIRAIRAAANANLQDSNLSDAQKRLREGLLSPATIQRNSQNLQDADFRGDRSRLTRTGKPDDDKPDKAAKTPWDRAVEGIQKHIAALRAEEAAIGRNEQFKESLKAEMSLLNAVQEEGVKLTDDQIAKYAEMRKTMEPLQALQAAGINLTSEQAEQFVKLGKAVGDVAQNVKILKAENDALFERQSMFLDENEKQIASVLRGIHGDAWKDFMNSGVAAAMRINDQLKLTKEIVTDFSTGMARDFVSALRNGENAWQAFSKAAVNALNRVIDKLVEVAAQRVALQALGALGLGGTSSAGSFFGPAGQSSIVGPMPPTASANGNIFSHGNIIPFARGGVINRPITFPMANGMGLAGEAGEEGILPLRRIGGKLGVHASGGGKTIVNIKNYSGEKAKSESRTTPNGDEIVDVIIGEVKRDMGRGGFDKQLARVGGSPRTVRR